MTLSVVEGHSPRVYCKPFQVEYFKFVAHLAVRLHLQSFLLNVIEEVWTV